MLRSGMVLDADPWDSNAGTYGWMGEHAPVLLGVLVVLVAIVTVVRGIRWLLKKDDGDAATKREDDA